LRSYNVLFNALSFLLPVYVIIVLLIFPYGDPFPMKLGYVIHPSVLFILN